MGTKQILFKLKLQGNGVVNFDSKEQKYMLYKTDNGPAYEVLKNDNGKFAKKSFVQIGEKEDGTPLFHSRLKISSNCLRHAIFEKDSPITLSQALVTQNDELFAFFVSSFLGLTRGYMITNQQKQSFIRASALTITSAEETSGATPHLEMYNCKQIDGLQKREDEKGATSLFYSDTVGDTTYECKGFIDLAQLSFLSCDEQYGRVAFKPEWIEGEHPLMEKMFQKHYNGNAPFTIGHFSSTLGSFGEGISEYGIKFDNTFVRWMAEQLLLRIGQLHITRASAYANACSLECKVVPNGFSTFDDNGWVLLQSIEDIQSFMQSVEIADVYHKID